MEASQVSGSQRQSVGAYDLMKSVMKTEGDATQKLLESMPTAEETRKMALSVNPSVGKNIDYSA